MSSTERDEGNQYIFPHLYLKRVFLLESKEDWNILTQAMRSSKISDRATKSTSNAIVMFLRRSGLDRLCQNVKTKQLPTWWSRGLQKVRSLDISLHLIETIDETVGVLGIGVMAAGHGFGLFIDFKRSRLIFQRQLGILTIKRDASYIWMSFGNFKCLFIFIYKQGSLSRT